MADLNKEVLEILDKLDIQNGIVINTSTEQKLDTKTDKIECKTIPIENLDNELSGQKNIRAIIVNEKIFEESNKNYLEKFRDILILVITENPIDKRTVFELLSGQCNEKLKIDGYTGRAIKENMEKLGFTCSAEIKKYKEVKPENEENIFLSQGSLLNHYLNWLEEYVQAELDVEYFVQAYQYTGMTSKEQESKAPFLSVITRTQGKRIEPLRETLLSLAGQSCDDFEVLIMGHNMELQNEKKVLQVIEETPGFLKQKIRFIPVTGGNRSTPINEGFKKARGSYAVIFDDDDLVFDNWVAAFKEKAQEYPGRVIHSYVVSQYWSLEKDDSGREILRSEDAPNNQFCKDFHFINELYGNSCPVLGLAFPLFPFKKMGFKFDETLDTTEDWDYLMSICDLCGVADVQEVTSMYRLWNNTENSHSLHDVEIWNTNRKKIQSRMKNRPLLLPEQYVGELISAIETDNYLFKKGEKNQAQITPLYYDKGSGYNEKDVKRIGSAQFYPQLNYEYHNLEEVGGISSLRWDPSEFGDICVENPRFVIDLKNGKRIVKYVEEISSNGFRIGNNIIFFHPDPQMYVKFSRPLNISKVTILGTMSQDITQDMHNQLAHKYNSNIIIKTKTNLKAFLKKIKRHL